MQEIISRAAAREEIYAFAAGRTRVVRATDLVDAYKGSSSGAMIFRCEGGGQILAKGVVHSISGVSITRALITDYVVARLGQLIEAPVGEILFAELPPESRLGHRTHRPGRGIAHARPCIEGLLEPAPARSWRHAYNRPRFASTCVLWSWVCNLDPELFALPGTEAIVSFDHGGCLAGGPDWTPETLQQEPVAIHHPYFQQAQLSVAELACSVPLLAQISVADIDAILAGPPPDWGLTAHDKAALAEYICRRRDVLVSLLQSAST